MEMENTTRSIIKNTAWGNVSALAKAVMKDSQELSCILTCNVQYSSQSLLLH